MQHSSNELRNCRRRRWVLWLFTVALLPHATQPFCIAQVVAPKPSAESREGQTIDEQLLDDLVPTSPKSTVRRDGKSPRGATNPAGEDVGRSRRSESWSREISEKMRSAERLLANEQTAEDARPIQEEVTLELGRLIEQMRRQSASESRQRKSAQESSAQGNQPSDGEPNGSGARKPAGKAARSKQIDQWTQRVWGVLPSRIQDQIKNMANEEFLPAYEDIIRDYYEQLSERSSER